MKDFRVDVEITEPKSGRWKWSVEAALTNATNNN